MKNIKNLVIFILLISLILVSALLYVKSEENTNYKNTSEYLNEKVKTYRNKLNQEIAEKKVLVVSNEKYIEDIALRDSAIWILKEEIRNNKNLKKKKGEIVYIKNKTNIKKDWKIKPGLIDVLDDKWVSGIISTNTDSVHLDFNVKNEFVVTFTKKKDHLFSSPYPVATIKNLNPNTTTENMQVIQLKKYKESRIIVGPSVTYGIDSNFNPHLSVGISVTYRLISL